MSRGKQSKHNTNKKFSRNQPNFSGDLILIVCEGAKTEPEYFKSIKRIWKIAPLQVQICGEECGSDPVSVVQYAIEERMQKSKSGGLAYDQVWCVIDQDRHTNLPGAINTAKAHKINISLSCPCFAFQNADSLIKDLRQHLPQNQYDKAKPPMNALLPNISTALKNADKVRKSNEASSKKSPSTNVDLLVNELIKIKHINLELNTR